MTVALRLCLGLLLVGAVVWFQGSTKSIGDALATAGWLGVIGVSCFHLVPMSVCGLAWRSLLPRAPEGATLSFVLGRWVRDGVNQVLPFMPLGGEVASAWLVGGRGIGGTTAAALTVVDITAEVLSQALFSLLGVTLWILRHPSGDILGSAGLGVALTLPMLIGLILAQRLGLVRLLEKLARKVMPPAWRAPDQAQGIHDGIMEIYARRRRFLVATAIHLSAWIVACGEAWLALRVVGHPLPVGDTIAMESVIYAVRNAAFLVPGALGIQEGAYVLVGAALGVPAEAALAVALIKRCRELLLGVPAVITWQWLGRKTRTRRHAA
jgi:putative membrane protein